MKSACLALLCFTVICRPGLIAQNSPNTTAPSRADEVTLSAPGTKDPESAQNPRALVVPESTPVKLKLLHSLYSKTVVVDDPLNFAVAENVVVDGRTLIKAGATAIGRVRQAKPARMLGRGGQLSLEMQYLKVGRTRVPLRGSQARAGDNKKGETVAWVALFGLSGLVKHGTEIEVKEGSLFTAYVDETTELPQESATPSQPSN